MKLMVLLASVVTLLAGLPVATQAQQTQLVADSLAVQAEGSFETDPDLATLVFSIRVQEKDLKQAYARAAASLERILQLAQRNGLGKQEVSTGALTVTPQQDWNDRKARIRSYRVERRVTFEMRDFSRIGALIDEAVQDEITDFRSLTYTLENEEAAKQKAIAAAARNAEARARASLGDNGRKLGVLRSISVEVKQAAIVLQSQARDHITFYGLTESSTLGSRRAVATLPPPPPEAAPERIRVNATVQCLYQLI